MKNVHYRSIGVILGIVEEYNLSSVFYAGHIAHWKNNFIAIMLNLQEACSYDKKIKTILMPFSELQVADKFVVLFSEAYENSFCQRRVESWFHTLL